MNLNTYATLTAFRERQGLAASDTDDDARMLHKLRAATAQIDRYTGRSFIPTIAARRFDWRGAKTLLLRGFDLLELTGLTNGDNTAINLSAVVTLGGVNGPIIGVELDTGLATFVYQTTRTRAITVTGVWGWHDDYASAWKASGDTISADGITSSATTCTVANASGVDSWNESPRFQVGQLLKVDTEYLHLTGLSGNTLTVVRGPNGSTAANHTATTPIYVYVPPADMVEITLRWAGWLYKTEDAGDFGGATPAQSGAANVPPSLPADLVAVLANLRQTGGGL
ncbi:MAG: hypothetical protein IT324_08865 [Anaerolineae bacterium]|nr:hypothetical protein [Anaerolineae bacterium]